MIVLGDIVGLIPYWRGYYINPEVLRYHTFNCHRLGVKLNDMLAIAAMILSFNVQI